MKIKKGDKVRIITGKDKYRADNKETHEHEVLACYPKENRILVKDVNVVPVTPSPARRASRAAGLRRKLPLTPPTQWSYAPSAASPPVWVTALKSRGIRSLRFASARKR